MATITGCVASPVPLLGSATRLTHICRPSSVRAFTCRTSTNPSRSRGHLQVLDFKFMKDLGLKKPAFLPDFGKDKRKALLDRFYTNFDAQTYNELLADNFEIVEASENSKPYTKQDWMKLMLESTIPAIPDFCWSHATDGTKDDDGYSIVVVQAKGHHTGKAFSLPGTGLAPIEPSGKRFLLEEEKVRVKVEDGKIQRMEVLPSKGAGPLALYKALGGTVPAKQGAAV